RWSASSGPGSMTAISSTPTRYVLVPGPVMTPGFGASTRRTSGLRAHATPGVSSATLIVPLRAARGRSLEHVVDGFPLRQPLQAALGRHHQVDGALAMATEGFAGTDPL